jgi:hypothetical protein
LPEPQLYEQMLRILMSPGMQQNSPGLYPEKNSKFDNKTIIMVTFEQLKELTERTKALGRYL